MNRSGLTCLLGESASPFIDEGDGLTSERERVHVLPSLVAHAGGYKLMLGAHNTVGENVGAYNTAWVLTWQGGRRVLFP